MVHRPHVVIIGAGFGGLQAAKELASARVHVTLVDRHNFHTFQPLLYQVATAGLNAADIGHPIRDIFRDQHNLSFRRASVAGCRWDDHILELDEGHGLRTELAFDQLIVAAGATTNFFGLDGAHDHAFPLYQLADALRLRNHVIGRFEAADAEPSLVDDGALTFVVVGGGPTGVEVAGALAELFDHVLAHDYHDIDARRSRVVLVEMEDELLRSFKPPSRRHAANALKGRGVELRLGRTIKAVDSRSVTFESGEVLPAHTLVWAAGVKANPLVEALGLDTGAGGRIKVERDLRIVGHPEAFAIGDIAAIEGADRVLPQLAPVAMQSGRHAAAQVERSLRGLDGLPFHYVDKGTMATIGRRAAVAELPLGINLQGSPAWFAWLGLHLVFLVGFRNRISVLASWAWNYFTWGRGPRLILETTRQASDVPTATEDD